MRGGAWYVVRGAWGVVVAGVITGSAPQRLSAQAPLEDNSFLVEEAYNQDPRVVQHISTAELHHGEALYSFTQEWPVRGMRRQLSYTLTAAHDASFAMGDALINFRLQVVNGGPARLYVAPRLSAILPLGDANKLGGNGGWGAEGVVPLSWEASPFLSIHADLGATWRPSAENGIGQSAATLEPYAAASAIIFLAPELNVLIESTWRGSKTVIANDQTASFSDHALLIGVRKGFDLPGKLQLVPGIAWMPAIGTAPSGAFLYFSAEHPF